MRFLTSGARVMVLAAMAALAVGCTYGGPSGNIVGQRLSWFSYLGGEDIRQTCRPGAADRLRFVYNANYRMQSRGYDLLPTGAGGAVLRQVVDRGVTVTAGQPFDPLTLGAPIHAETPLTAAEMAELGALAEASGVFEPPPVGLRLSSQSHYWIVTGCRDGRFFLTGYRFPSARYDRIRFIEFLQSADATGIRWPRLPDPGTAIAQARCPRPREDRRFCFWVEVGDDGLVGR